MGRPKSNVTKTPAEKMREYRERQKQKLTASEVALEMVAWLEEKKVTLLKLTQPHIEKGRSVEIRHRETISYSELVVGGGFGSFHFDNSVFKYLVLTGSIEFVRKGSNWDKESWWRWSPDVDFACKH